VAVNAPSIDGLADAKAVGGGTLTLTLTPPAAGDYDHCQVLYRQGAATAWTTGPTYTGAQGVQGTVSITGLTTGLRTDVIVYAVDATGNAGPPSVVRRQQPTTGLGCASRRIEKHVIATLEDMTIANGFPWDVADVVLWRGEEDTRDDGSVVLYVATTTLDQKDIGCRGTQGITDDRLHVMVLASRDLGTSLSAASTAGAREVIRADAAHELAAQVTKALLDDPTRGGVAIDTEGVGQELTPKAELKIADATILANFEIHYRTDRQNPDAEV
jgi:hypothetical protein